MTFTEKVADGCRFVVEKHYGRTVRGFRYFDSTFVNQNLSTSLFYLALLAKRGFQYGLQFCTSKFIHVIF